MQVTIYAALRRVTQPAIVTCLFKTTEARCLQHVLFQVCTLAHELMKTMHEYKFIFVKKNRFLSFIFFSLLKGALCYYFFHRLIWLMFEDALETKSN